MVHILTFVSCICSLEYIERKMSSPVHLRVVFDGDDARKLTLMPGIPASVDQLNLEIKTVFGLQYKDADFGN